MFFDYLQFLRAVQTLFWFLQFQLSFFLILKDLWHPSTPCWLKLFFFILILLFRTEKVVLMAYAHQTLSIQNLRVSGIFSKHQHFEVFHFEYQLVLFWFVFALFWIDNSFRSLESSFYFQVFLHKILPFILHLPWNL